MATDYIRAEQDYNVAFSNQINTLLNKRANP
ncbi:hypothetical protein Acife_2234 [Acidithiobacillus ferrivorans SS3]|jgi:hypothetical protein|uniref:Uncharacterized protein n=1 Tax=Acidithiobacillus ferrivorans SS3 TaxID=743299 RepID=G0JNK7_9PROT|nr:hypothetical protein Acife_2234 [Acidithiobacillus ferrivorans SS3]